MRREGGGESWFHGYTILGYIFLPDIVWNTSYSGTIVLVVYFVEYSLKDFLSSWNCTDNVTCHVKMKHQWGGHLKQILYEKADKNKTKTFGGNNKNKLSIK